MIAEEDENLSDTPLEVDGQEADDIMNSFSNANGFDVRFICLCITFWRLYILFYIKIYYLTLL